MEEIEIVEYQIAEIVEMVNTGYMDFEEGGKEIDELKIGLNKLYDEKQRLEKELNIKALYNDNIKPITICYS